MSPRTYYLLGLAGSAFTTLLLLFGIGALGIIGAGGRPDRVYAAVLVVLAVASVVARLRPPAMTLALAATALTQGVVTLTVFLTGQHHTDGASVVDILGINAMYVVLWSVSAVLFRRAAEQASPLAHSRS